MNSSKQQLATTSHSTVNTILTLLASLTFDELIDYHFLPARRYASAGNSDRNVSVCPSVRLSRAGIVSKRRKLAA